MAQPNRQAQTRAENLRPAIGGGGQVGVLNVDTSALSKDHELMWATESVLGQENRENVRLQMGRGFQPVLASDMPSEAGHLLPGEAHSAHSLVRRGGMVLMKRLKSVGDAERAALAADNADALRAVNREFEQKIAGTEGYERMRDGGVVSRTERTGAAAFPE